MLALSLALGSSAAASRALTLHDYVHTAWGKKDKAPSFIQAIAQTPDGSLWLGCFGGLFRFDGLSFEQYQGFERATIPDNTVESLFVDRHGDLWVGLISGNIGRIHDGITTKYATPTSFSQARIYQFAEDQQGELWAASAVGLLKFNGIAWALVNDLLGLPHETLKSLYVDNLGTLWMTTPTSLLYLRKGAGRVELVTMNRMASAAHIAVDSGKHIWVADPLRSIYPVLRPGETPTIQLHHPRVAYGAITFLFDKRGEFWVPTLGDGIRHIALPNTINGKLSRNRRPIKDAFTVKDGLTSDVGLSIFEDREGTIWVGSQTGLDRFRPSDIVSVAFPGNLTGSDMDTGPDGLPRIVTVGGLYSVDKYSNISNLVNTDSNLSQIFHDADGTFWLAGDSAIIRIEGNKREFIKPPPHFSLDYKVMLDATGALYAYSRHFGLFRWDHLSWHPVAVPFTIPEVKIDANYNDGRGHAWIALADGTLLYFSDGSLSRVGAVDKIGLGPIRTITVTGNDLLFGASHGLAWIDAGKNMHFIRHDFAQDQPAKLIKDDEGDLWCIDGDHAEFIRLAEWQRAFRQGDLNWNAESYDLSNFLPSSPESATLDSSGRLWIASRDAVIYVDRSLGARNLAKPPIVVTSISVGNKELNADNAILPALTRNLSLHFAVMSLVSPEHNEVRYKLDGVDRYWQDGGTRREAFYTNLSPGTYRFHVIGSNNDGVWNLVGTTVTFEIKHAWYETLYFRLACLLLSCTLLFLAQRWLAARVEYQSQLRFRERLEERSRVARDLHDTLLQTLQGCRMVATTALDKTDSESQRKDFANVTRWLDDAVIEGRAALTSLREPDPEEKPIHTRLFALAEQCVSGSSIRLQLYSNGKTAPLPAILNDELFKIAAEAIRNARQHSNCSELKVGVQYGNPIRIEITDNGIGMPKATLKIGTVGHFGLSGMRERAKKLGATLTIRSSTDGGTSLRLTLGRRWLRIWDAFRNLGRSQDIL